MLYDWKKKENSDFSLLVPQQVQDNFKYEYWIPISLIAFFTRQNGYTEVSDVFLASKIYDFSKDNVANLLHDLENRGYIKKSFRQDGYKKRRTIILTTPLYEMFNSAYNNMHEPIQL